MARMFTRERFGTPQIVALVFLFFFFAQCAFFISNVPLTQLEANHVRVGLDFLARRGPAGDVARSPMPSLAAAIPLRVVAPDVAARSYDQILLDHYRWLIRLPFLFSGLFLGASLWYVARRLYGNNGGYIALGLYCFNPAFVARSSLAQGEVIAAWGTFGAVFTAIAVAHTLYASREVVLWNWRRILLLGFCVLLMIGAQFSTAPVLVLALLFMLWAVPQRRGAALTIWLAAFLIGMWMLSGAYLFRMTQMASALAGAHWLPGSLPSILHAVVYRMAAIFYTREAAAPMLVFVIALATYFAWKRARFFGVTAPLLVFLVLVILGVVSTAQLTGFLFIALPFAMLFGAGVFTDILEDKHANLGLGVVGGVILTQAVLGITSLAQLVRSIR